MYQRKAKKISRYHPNLFFLQEQQPGIVNEKLQRPDNRQSNHLFTGR